MVALAKERSSEPRVRMWKRIAGELEERIFDIGDAPDAKADGWRMTPIEFHENPKVRTCRQSIEMANNYCRDWNMQLNLHLLTAKHQIVDLSRRCLRHKMNPKMGKGAMRRDFERIARKMGVWMGDE